MIVTLVAGLLAATVQAQSCTPAPAGLVGWWKGDGNANDSAGTNNGTLINGVGFGPGEVGEAFSFNGTNQYVEIPQSPSLNVGSQVTIEFWMNANTNNAMNSYQGLVTSDFYGIEIANGYALGPLGINFFISTDSGGGGASPYNYPDTATPNGGGAVVSAGAWHHIAGTYDGAKLQLYIDGQPWGQPNYHSGAISPMLTNSFVAIGSEDGRSVCPGCVRDRYFNGLIRAVNVYNRALSANEIQAIYDAGSAGKCPALPIINIMPMGDSVTARGGAPESSYRYWLYTYLTNGGFLNTRFVGSQTGIDGASDGPPAHSWPQISYEGGSTTAGLAPVADGWSTWEGINDATNAASVLNRGNPGATILLLDLGANDHIPGSGSMGPDLSQMETNLEAMIHTFYQRNSNTVVLLAVPTPWVIRPPDLITKQFMFDLGSGVTRAAYNLRKAGVNVVVVNLGVGFDPFRDTKDGTHPNVRGEQIIARQYFNALRPILRKMEKERL